MTKRVTKGKQNSRESSESESIDSSTLTDGVRDIAIRKRTAGSKDWTEHCPRLEIVQSSAKTGFGHRTGTGRKRQIARTATVEFPSSLSRQIFNAARWRSSSRRQSHTVSQIRSPANVTLVWSVQKIYPSAEIRTKTTWQKANKSQPQRNGPRVTASLEILTWADHRVWHVQTLA